MIIRWMMALGMGLMVAVAAAQDPPALKDQKEKLSYALGMDLGNQLRKQSIDVNPALFGKGLADALSGGKTLLTEEEVRAAVAELQAEMKRRVAENRRSAVDANKKAGEAFLAENSKKEGVVTLPSGLQYKVLKAGRRQEADGC